MLRATVLIQHSDPKPGAATQLADSLSAAPLRGLITAEPVIGAYDVVALVAAATTKGIAAAVVRIQGHPNVGLTLTLPHASNGLDDEDA
jgi:hypothetical protein